MYTYGYGYYGFDWTYLLLVIGMLLSLLASAKLKSTFARYKRVRSASGLTGEEAARRILYSAGITDVQVRPIAGSLTDHYDPRTKTVNLSQDIYGRLRWQQLELLHMSADMQSSMRPTMPRLKCEVRSFRQRIWEAACRGHYF